MSFNLVIPDITCTVSRDFYEKQNEKTFGTRNRRDAEIYEQTLSKLFPATFKPSPYVYSSDLYVEQHGLYIDCKYLSSVHFNIHDKKTFDKHVRAIECGELTHFLFWKSNKPLMNKTLEIGEAIHASYVSMVDAKTVLKSCVKSNFKNSYCYYTVTPL